MPKENWHINSIVFLYNQSKEICAIKVKFWHEKLDVMPVIEIPIPQALIFDADFNVVQFCTKEFEAAEEELLCKRVILKE